MGSVRVAIVEDDESYIGVLKTVFARNEQIRITDAFSNSVAFLNAIPQLDADLVLLDINMPKVNGIDCLRQLRQFRPECKAIMLTVVDDSDMILRAFLEGASGYLLKEASRKDITAAIEDTMTGGAPMSSTIARKVVNLLKVQEPPKASSDPDEDPRHALSKREYEILRLLAEGRKYVEIAEALFISLPTVKTHISHIYEKLKVRNKVEAVARLAR